MYIKRRLKKRIEQARKAFPAILVTGPRQSGKTTFLREEYGSGSHYVSFDDPLQRQFAREDPNGFLDQFIDKPVILDEIQYVPELFSWLKLRIDADRHSYGRYLMTGSQQFQLMQKISDSLAGRIAILDLLPFDFEEYLKAVSKTGIVDAIWYGGYPEVILHPEQRNLWMSSYTRTYVERDIRQIINIRDLGRFQQFLGLLAARIGQELNLSSLSRATGLSVPACKQWVHLLEAAYMVYQLRPFYKNFGKRLIKSSKIYFIDTAVAAYLSRQPSAKALWHGAMGGSFFENWIVIDTWKRLMTFNKHADFSFWRSHDGMEIDFVISLGGKLLPVEIKQTATPMPRHAAALTYFQKLAGTQCLPGVLVCTVREKRQLPGGITAMPWKEFGPWIESRAV